MRARDANGALQYVRRVRVLIAPDDFTGTLSAPAAAAAIARGWAQVKPADDLRLVPLSDGGPGFVAAMAMARGVPLREAAVTGPRGEAVRARWCLDGTTAYLEVAECCGLALIPGELRDPSHTTSAGVGDCMLAAIGEGATRLVIGLGGSGVNDGGAGMLEALGAVAYAVDGTALVGALQAGPTAFADIAAIDVSPAMSAVDGIEIVVASDVDNPLLGPRGATVGFGPQKGATEAQLGELEAALAHLSALLGRRRDGKDAAVALGAGAAGGIGFALLHLGGRRVAGIDTVLAEAGFDPNVDLVLTGEGALDWQTLRGKVITGVCRAAATTGAPVVALCGVVRLTPRECSELGLAGAYALVDLAGEERALGEAATVLSELAARVARTWG